MPPRVVNLDDEQKPNGASSAPPEREVTPPVKLTPADKKLVASISSAYKGIGTGLIGIGIRFEDEGIAGAGVQMTNMADVTASAWLDVANKNPKVKAYLKKVTEASAIGVLVGCHFAIALPLLASRGVIPTDVASMMAEAAANASTNGHP